MAFGRHGSCERCGFEHERRFFDANGAPRADARGCAIVRAVYKDDAGSWEHDTLCLDADANRVTLKAAEPPPKEPKKKR